MTLTIQDAAEMGITAMRHGLDALGLPHLGGTVIIDGTAVIMPGAALFADDAPSDELLMQVGRLCAGIGHAILDGIGHGHNIEVFVGPDEPELYCPECEQKERHENR